MNTDTLNYDRNTSDCTIPFIDECKYNDAIPPNNSHVKDISILNLNARSLVANYSRLRSISVFIYNSLNYNVIYTLSISLPNNSDITTISVNILNIKYIASGIYRSPLADISTYSDYILNNFELINRIYTYDAI